MFGICLVWTVKINGFYLKRRDRKADEVALIVIFGLMPFLIFFLAVTMGINH
jgi:hypothetical protein